MFGFSLYNFIRTEYIYIYWLITYSFEISYNSAVYTVPPKLSLLIKPLLNV
jgi:hypothetical protein